MASSVSETVILTLWHFSEEYIKANYFPQALKCLEALLSKNIAIPPVVEVKTRIKIVEILFEYTHSLYFAQRHLESALILAKTINDASLTLRIFYYLDKIYEKQNSPQLSKQIIQEALPISKSIWEDMYYHFLLRLANLSFNETNNPETILSYLDLGEKESFGSQSLLVNVVFRLSKIQTYLQINDINNASCYLQDLPPILNKLRGDGTISLTVEQIDIANQMNLHFLILSDLYSIRLGNFNTIDINLLLNYAEQLKQVSNIKTFYSWLRTGTMFCLIYLISGICKIPSCNFQSASSFLNTGLTWIHEKLSYETNSQGLVENDLKQDLQILLRFKYIFLENLILINLSNCNLIESVKLIEKLRNLSQNEFPEIFNIKGVDFETTLHILVSHLYMNLAQHEKAIDHLNYALSKSKKFENSAFCKLLLSLTYIQSGSPSKVTSLLNDHFLKRLENHPMISLKCLLKFAQGVLSLVKSDFTIAKELFTQCYQLNTTQLSNKFLLSQIFRYLGEILVSSTNNPDLPQAQKLLESSLLISYEMKDLTSQLDTCQIIINLFNKLGDKSTCDRYLNYSSQIRDKINQEINSTKNTQEYKNIAQFLSVASSTTDSSTSFFSFNNEAEDLMIPIKCEQETEKALFKDSFVKQNYEEKEDLKTENKKESLQLESNSLSFSENSQLSQENVNNMSQDLMNLAETEEQNQYISLEETNIESNSSQNLEIEFQNETEQQNQPSLNLEVGLNGQDFNSQIKQQIIINQDELFTQQIAPQNQNQSINQENSTHQIESNNQPSLNLEVGLNGQDFDSPNQDSLNIQQIVPQNENQPINQENLTLQIESNNQQLFAQNQPSLNLEVGLNNVDFNSQIKTEVLPNQDSLNIQQIVPQNENQLINQETLVPQIESNPQQYLQELLFPNQRENLNFQIPLDNLAESNLQQKIKQEEITGINIYNQEMILENKQEQKIGNNQNELSPSKLSPSKQFFVDTFVSTEGVNLVEKFKFLSPPKQ